MIVIPIQNLSTGGDKILDTDLAFIGPYRETAYSMSKIQIFKGGRSSLKTSRHVSRMVIDSILLPKTISFACAKSSEKLLGGLASEFTKVIERLTHGTYKPNEDFRLIKKPLHIKFTNGSEIHFMGSANIEDLKGRSVPDSSYRYGFVLLDEVADYNDIQSTMDLLMGTFARTNGNLNYNHYLWDDDDLELDRIALDEEGNAVMVRDQYGKTYPKIIPGKHTKGCIFLLSYNPPKNKYEEIFDVVDTYTNRDDAFIKHINYTDIMNELIAIGQMSVISEAETMKIANPQKYNHVWLGLATGTDGLFFDNFSPTKSRIEPNPELINKSPRFGVGVDFGVTNATAFVYGCINPIGDFVAIDTYCHSNKEETEENQKGVEEYTKDLINFVKQNRKITGEKRATPIFYDPSAKAFRLGIQSYLKKHPKDKNLIKLYKADNDRKSTLDTMKDYIITNRFKYFTTGNYLQLEDEIARAEEHRSGDDIVKVNDHVIDSIRYVLFKLHKLKRKER